MAASGQPALGESCLPCSRHIVRQAPPPRAPGRIKAPRQRRKAVLRPAGPFAPQRERHPSFDLLSECGFQPAGPMRSPAEQSASPQPPLMTTPEELRCELDHTDRRTLALIESLTDAKLDEPYHRSINPPNRQLGHSAFFYEYIILRKRRYSDPPLPYYDHSWGYFKTFRQAHLAAQSFKAAKFTEIYRSFIENETPTTATCQYLLGRPGPVVHGPPVHMPGVCGACLLPPTEQCVCGELPTSGSEAGQEETPSIDTVVKEF